MTDNKAPSMKATLSKNFRGGEQEANKEGDKTDGYG
jgi:hypothetical protein